jgi:hypothetical protein
MKLNLISVALTALAVSCFVLSGILLTQEIGEINRKLPEDQQISYWWIYSEKYARIKKEYKRLYPKGRIHTLANIFGLAGIALLLLAAIAAGFFHTF